MDRKGWAEMYIEGNLFRRIRYGLNILSILITWALENAIETSDSMKSRGYGLPERTAFSIYRFTNRDKILGTVMVFLSMIFTVGIAKGAETYASYNPRILLAGFTGSRAGHLRYRRAAF